MPEGDVVWRTARTLDRALTGQVLLATDFRVPRLATVDLSGQRVTGTVSRGKHLLTRIGEQHTLHTHLLMEGTWHLYRDGSRWRRPGHQARVVLRVPGWTAVGFALGVVELLTRSEEATTVGRLGPDLLGPDWDEEEAVHRLAADPNRELGDALLDQHNLAGIGNLYKSELCFLSGLHPATPVGRAGDLRPLVRRAKRLLEANKNRVDQTTTGDLARGRRTWVYRREREACRRCGTRIEVAMQGTSTARGQVERATYWCPTCQPLPD